jgi:hypothetical protein
MDAREHVESPARTHDARWTRIKLTMKIGASVRAVKISGDSGTLLSASLTQGHGRGPRCRVGLVPGNLRHLRHEVPVGWESVQETYEAKRLSTQQIPLE